MTLTIEVVPPASHNITLARVMTFADWKRVRTKRYELVGFHCEVCGGRGKNHPVECHEQWEYSGTVQTLKGVIALCTACHCVKHYGRMQMLGFEDDCHAQLMKVNGWTPREVLEHVRASAKDFRAIEKCVYKIDMRWVYTYAKCGPISRQRIDEIAQYSGVLQNNRVFRQIYIKNGPRVPVLKPWPDEIAAFKARQTAEREAREAAKRLEREAREAGEHAKRDAREAAERVKREAREAVKRGGDALRERIARVGGTKPVLAKLARGTSDAIRQTVIHFERGVNVNPDKVASVILPAVDACEVELRAMFEDRHETAAIPYRIKRIVRWKRYRDIADAFMTGCVDPSKPQTGTNPSTRHSGGRR